MAKIALRCGHDIYGQALKISMCDCSPNKTQLRDHLSDIVILVAEITL
jgi:hypothetical protein